MSTTNRQLNLRKKKIKAMTSKMKKEGYEFNKAVKNTLTYYHPKKGKKRVNLEED